MLAMNPSVQIEGCYSAMTSPSPAIFHPSCAYVQPNTAPSSENGASSERCKLGFLCAVLTEVRYPFYAHVSLAITGCCEKVCYFNGGLVHIAHARRASGRTHPAPESA
jgi:hypothetical protein